MRLWRIFRRAHPNFMDGEGARRYGGRWNSVGRAVVYTSAARALAILELLCNASPEQLPDDLAIVELAIPENVAIERLDPVPTGWNAIPASRTSTEAGDAWLARGSSLALVVPSVLGGGVDENVLINPAHPDARAIVIETPKPFVWDPRLQAHYPTRIPTLTRTRRRREH